MKKHRVVVALGGNAILTNDPSAKGQQAVLQATAKQLVEFVKSGYELIVAHGNGPQVGNLMLQQAAGSTDTNPAMPLDTAVAMTQGSIGYWLSNAIREALVAAKLDNDVATLVTQVQVDANDPAFKQPTKPIGPFYTNNAVIDLQAKHSDWTFMEDAGRGYRRVVPSPKPTGILESNAIKDLVAAGVITIAAGGGGIPVVGDGQKQIGVEAVVDKDFAAEKLAELVHADLLVILTAVDNVFINFNQANETKLTNVTPQDLKTYINQAQFAPGSMLPKVQATIDFVENTNGKAVITSLDNVAEFLEHGTGTIISNQPVLI